jgi:hypothetical protein
MVCCYPIDTGYFPFSKRDLLRIGIRVINPAILGMQMGYSFERSRNRGLVMVIPYAGGTGSRYSRVPVVQTASASSIFL